MQANAMIQFLVATLYVLFKKEENNAEICLLTRDSTRNLDLVAGLK